MTDSPMEFRILGPLEVRANGAPVPTGGPRQRALLALLLLNANRVVSRDRLADELTSDERPDVRDRALRVQVSRLRKALGEGKTRLVTQRPGYLIRVGPGELDFHRFEELLEEGRSSAADGDFECAAQLLRQAGSLWYGRALADLEFEPFARLEIERLEELRLVAIEERVDAELALGRDASLVPELETLVGEHPLRERVRAQLMLALYRSGRQAEALAVYRAAHEQLVENLGLDPSPELRALEAAILSHDDSLARPPAGKTGVVPTQAPAAPAPAPSARAGRGDAHGGAPGRSPRRAPARRRRLVLAALGGLAAVGAALAAVLLQGGGSSLAADGNALVLTSTRTGAPVDAVPLGSQPTQVSGGFGSLWVTHFDTDAVSRVDLKSRAVRQTIRVGDGPSGLAAGEGAVWVANTLDGTVSQIEPDTQAVVKTIAVGTQPSAVVVAAGAVWVANRADGTVARVDPRSGRVTNVLIVGEGPTSLAAGEGTIWVANHDDGSVSRIDTGARRVAQTTHVADAPSAIAVGEGGVWIADSLGSTVSRLDPQRDVVTTTIPVRGSAAGLAAVGGAVWVADADGGTVTRIDPDRRSVAVESPVGAQAGPVTAAAGGLWIGTRAGGARHRGGTLTLLNAFSPVRSLDPAIVGSEISPAWLLGTTNDGLVTLNHVDGPEGTRVVPDLALSVPLPTDGGHTYVFRMRSGIRYSSGEPVRPSDVRHSLERLFEMRSPGMPYYERIVGADACRRKARCDLSEGIVADDRRRTVTFHLTDPDPSFVHKLALPFAFVVPSSSPRHEARSPLPATGPYQLRFDTPAREFVLTRNPRFRVWSRAAQPDGYPDRIVMKLGLPPGRAATMMERGRADLMVNMGPPPHGHREVLRTRFAGQLRVNTAPATDFFFLNVRARPFDDPRVRRAVNYAIDRQRVVDLFGGPDTAAPTCQLLPPQVPGYRRYCPYTREPRADGSWTGPDLARARRLVAASGTKGMRVGVWTTPRPQIVADEGRYLTGLLRRLGYRASLHLLAPDQRFFDHTNDSRNGAQVISGGWNADYGSPASVIGKMSCRYFVPGSASNTTNSSEFCDPELDRRAIRAEALRATNTARSDAAWAGVDRELTDLAVWLPTVTPKTTDILSKRVGNYRYHPLWGVLVDQLWVR